LKKTIFALMGVIILVISSNFVIIVGTGNYIGREDISLQTSPPAIPQSSTQTVQVTDLYIFEFSAEEGDNIHYRVSVDEGSAVAVYLIPLEELSNLRQGESFRIVSDGTNEQTRDFRANVEIPFDGEFAVVIRPVDWGSSTVDVVLGSGIFSSIIVTLGGYLQFALLVAVLILITIGIQIYRKRNKEPQRKEYAQTSQAPLSQNQQPTAREKNQTQSRPPPSYEEQNQQFKDPSQQQQSTQEQTPQESPSQKKTPKGKLKNLREMKEDGLISEEEFERKKDEILDNY